MIEIQQKLAERYRIISALGHGGIAQVYLAQDELLARQVAVKVIYPHLSRQKMVLDRFKREVAITRTINHPGIIQIYDLIDDRENEATFLVMEYLAGGDLKGRILDYGQLASSEVVRIGTAALSALQAAHGSGIVHRDVKPHNILFDQEGTVKLSDFGLARSGSIMGLTTHSHIAGTPEYIAPEMIESRYVDTRSDIYSLGITLYEAITGGLPFVSNSPYQTMRMHLETEVVPPQEINNSIPGWLSEVILKAIAKDPSERFQNTEEFSEALTTEHVLSLQIKPDSHRCPECGNDLLDILPFCWNCQTKPILLAPPGAREPVYRVVVLGPGKVAEKISHDLRNTCLKLLGEYGQTKQRMVRSIPRLPFILVTGLNESSATDLVGKLNNAGIEAVAEGKSNRKLKRRISLALWRKVWRMSGRFTLIALTTSTGIISLMAKAPANLIFFSFVAVVIGIPLGCVYRFRLPELRWRQTSQFPLIRAFASLMGELSSSTLQGMSQRVAGKGFGLLQKIDGDPILDQDLKQDLSLTLEQHLHQVVKWLSLAQQLDNLLVQQNEFKLYREMGRMDSKLIESRTVNETESLIKQREDIHGLLETRRKVEQVHDRLLNHIFRFSSQLDSLSVQLAAYKKEQVQGILRNMDQISQDIELESQSIVEVETEFSPDSPFTNE